MAYEASRGFGGEYVPLAVPGSQFLQVTGAVLYISVAYLNLKRYHGQFEG